MVYSTAFDVSNKLSISVWNILGLILTTLKKIVIQWDFCDPLQCHLTNWLWNISFSKAVCHVAYEWGGVGERLCCLTKASLDSKFLCKSHDIQWSLLLESFAYHFSLTHLSTHGTNFIYFCIFLPAKSFPIRNILAGSVQHSPHLNAHLGHLL